MTPWGSSTPICDLLPDKVGRAVREHYEERAAIMEYDGAQGRGRAELFAYANLIARLWDTSRHLFSQEVIDKANVVVQLDRAARIQRDLEFSHSIGVRP